MLRSWKVTPTRTLPVETGATSLDELTRVLPEGFYTTFRTYDGCTRVLGLTAHLRRLYEPVPAAGVDPEALRRQLRSVLELFRPGEARVRVVMTRQGELYVAALPLQPLPATVYADGVAVVTLDLQRPDPQLKSTHFISDSRAERRNLEQEGVFEALLLRNGKILEGMTSNFFYVPAGSQRVPTLATAGDDILPGVTRQAVLTLAGELGLSLQYRPLAVDQIAGIQEAFITSSSRGVVPVIRIDSLTVGQGRPGSVTRQLMGAYDPYVIGRAEEI